jgi:signal peptidase I
MDLQEEHHVPPAPNNTPTFSPPGSGFEPASPQGPNQENLIISAVKGIGKIAFEFAITLVVIFVLSMVIRAFVLQPFVVEGQSMEPTFHNQEYLLAEKISQHFNDFNRGDVIIFRSPTENFNLIKRVIGLPGERIVINQDGVTIYQRGATVGTALTEGYINKADLARGEPVDISVETDEYFVLGDNRPNSVDSRIFGPIKKSSVIGKVWLTVFPFLNVQFFSAPIYPRT